MSKTFEFVKQYGVSIDSGGKVMASCRWSDYLRYFQTPQFHNVHPTTTIYADGDLSVDVTLFVPIEEYREWRLQTNDAT